MNLRGKTIFTGRMLLLEGWEVRPFAIKADDGSFSPYLAARQHAPGSPGHTFSFDRTCLNKEEAFEVALAQSRSLVCGK